MIERIVERTHRLSVGMGGPPGVSASVVAVLQLASTATRYLKDVRSGTAERTRLRDELRSTVCLLEMLQDRLEDSEGGVDDSSTLRPQAIDSLSGTDGPLQLFQQTLEGIIAKLAPQDELRRRAQPFTWPFDKKKVAELLACLERLKSNFNLILQNNIAYMTCIHCIVDQVCANFMLDNWRDRQTSSLIDLPIT